MFKGFNVLRARKKYCHLQSDTHELATSWRATGKNDD